ncbi:hypothetical protein GL50803_0014877 [Giardia duodenalis]|uniref:Uncharacterized protein n=1 Tax=Giardia intestinalis (strain ATCC 50803 / WB clone C6) TaxID=184922 RepID=D3KH93_GIAIC|nr:hypothetical protein GL50803_0014877 [Giardia intestinalis]KAE8301930.1 hypothetical protein GL50803_0014877 [Giardia intestinalis]
MEFTLLHKTFDGSQAEMKVCLSCVLSSTQDRVDMTLTNSNDMFFLYEVSMGAEDFRTVCTTFSYDFLHISSLPSLLNSDILPTLSSTPSAASVGTDICILETDAQMETAVLQFLTVRPSLRVPFFSVQLRKGSDRSIARNISTVAAQLEARLNTELSTFQLRIGRVESEKATLESKLALAESSTRQLEARMQELASNYEAQLAELQREKLATLEAKASVETKLADVLAELSAAKTNSAMHMSHMNISEEELQKANARIAELETLLQSREQQYSEEIGRLRGELDRVTNLLDNQIRTTGSRDLNTGIRPSSTMLTASVDSGNGSDSHGSLLSGVSTNSIQYTPLKQEDRPQPGMPSVRFSKDDDLTESSLSTNQTTISRARSTNARNILAKYGINSTYSTYGTQSNASIPPKPASINNLPIMHRLKQLELQAQAKQYGGTPNRVTVGNSDDLSTNLISDRIAKYTVPSLATSSTSSSTYSQVSFQDRGIRLPGTQTPL